MLPNYDADHFVSALGPNVHFNNGSRQATLVNPRFPVSQRANEFMNQNYPLMEGMVKYFENPYSNENPDGIINLGTAENTLNIMELNEKLKSSNILNIEEKDIKYNGFVGTETFRTSLAKFLNNSYQLHENLIKFDNISVHNGCGSVLEMLGYLLCDPNDAIIIPSPYYSGFDKDLGQRPQVKLIQAPSTSESQKVELTAIKKAFEEYESPNRIKAVLIMNPVNPTGEILDLKLIEEISDFCQLHNLHLIVDEIYAFTKLDDHARFKSAWTLNKPHVHLVWGMSKDFCLNGFRTGLLITKNEELLKGMMELSYFYMIPMIVQNLLEEVVDDLEFCTRYITNNCNKLKLNLDLVFKMIGEFNSVSNLISYVVPQGGFFIYVNLSKFLKNLTKQEEYDLWIELLEMGVYFALGEAFHGPTGWFRICFAIERQLLELALGRMVRVLMKRIS